MGRPLNQVISDFLAAEMGETQTTVEFALKNGTFRRYATDVLTISSNAYADDLSNAGDIEQSIESGTDRVQITIGNQDKAIGLDIKAGLIHFAAASLGRFFRLADGTSEWREVFFGVAIPVNYNEREARIEIVDEMVAAGYCVANWTLAPVCNLIFKSPECGYAGPETVCNHLLKGDCAKYANTHRFVGEVFPIVKNEPAPAAPSDAGRGVGAGSNYYDPGNGWVRQPNPRYFLD